MKAIIRKELRENLVLAVVGLAIFGLLLLQSYRDAVGRAETVAGQQFYYGQNSLQPLVAPEFMMVTGFFCAIFGAVLGWLQIFHERNRDLWAFLVHRPFTRSQIFCSKAVAGLSLYFFTTCLPLIWFVAAVATPGHVAAPFELVMVLPAVCLVLSGLAGYFAGMLTGLRQARWYASRALGVGVAILVVVGAAAMPEFWASLLVIAMGVGVLAVAGWGSFQANGEYQDQPVTGKLALTLAMATGAGLAVIAAAALLGSLLFPNRSYSWSYYAMTRDGTIYQVRNGPGRHNEIVDLEGKPLKDPQTGRPIAMEEFNRMLASSHPMVVTFEPLGHENYYQSSRYFRFWESTPDTIWYYWAKYGKLVGFDVTTHRVVGSLGPKGFTKDLTAGERFSQPLAMEYNYGYIRHTFKTSSAIYQLDLRERAIKSLVEATEPFGAAADVIGDEQGAREVVVVTKEFISLTDDAGKQVWREPYQPAYPDYSSIQVWAMPKRKEYAVWISPSQTANLRSGGTLPTHVTWISQEQGVIKNKQLPATPPPSLFDPTEKFIAAIFPPALLATVRILNPHALPFGLESKWKSLALTSLVAALALCVTPGWWLGRRYNLPAPARVGWAIFHLLAGIPGLLAFLAVQEWPTREACANCKKLRVVDREQCEHCGAGFPPPEKIGSEIFEELGKVQQPAAANY